MNGNKEEIDEIMEEMEAATPKSEEKTQSFEVFTETVTEVKIETAKFIDRDDTTDAMREPRKISFPSISNLFKRDPKKPGLLHPSRPTESKYYDFTNSNVGIALIFNQVTVKGESARKGSDKDADDLQKVLSEIGFQVEICNDFTVEEIKGKLWQISKLDHSDNDCLFVTIMTHGDRDGKILAADGDFMVQDLWDYFLGNNCETLIGKPKLFFIQACRGKMTDPGILLKPKPRMRMMQMSDSVDSAAFEEQPFVLPTLADLLVMYSTAEGYYSFRNPKDGSWFIQALCKELRENGHEELMTILTGVNRTVAYAKQSHVPGEAALDAMKQMPNIVTMLTKSMYFKKKHYKLNLEDA